MTKNDLKWRKTTKKSSVADQRTNQKTDRVGCRVACTRLKNKHTILEVEIFPHFSIYISLEVNPIKQKLVTNLKLFKFASELCKPHLAI